MSILSVPLVYGRSRGCRAGEVDEDIKAGGMVAVVGKRPLTFSYAAMASDRSQEIMEGSEESLGFDGQRFDL